MTRHSRRRSGRPKNYWPRSRAFRSSPRPSSPSGESGRSPWCTATPETAEDADLIYGALHRLAGECGQLAGYRGGNDYTTFLFTGPDAETAAKAFLARAQAMEHPRWWRITATAHPVWH